MKKNRKHTRKAKASTKSTTTVELVNNVFQPSSTVAKMYTALEKKGKLTKAELKKLGRGTNWLARVYRIGRAGKAKQATRHYTLDINKDVVRIIFGGKAKKAA